MPLDGVTIKTIIEELKQNILGGKIDKINQAENDEILFTIRNNKQNYKLIVSSNPTNPRIYTCKDYNKENPLQAPLFLMVLRKHINNGIITNIEQHDLDRIIIIEIESYNELKILSKKLLCIEIMGKHSNIILVEKHSNKIIDAIKRIPLSLSSVREVLPQRNFTLPPSQNKLNPFISIDVNELEYLFRKKNIELYKAIYSNFEGISPILAKEICFISNISDIKKTFELNSIQYERLQNSFVRVFESVKRRKTEPTLILKEGEK